MTFLRTLFTATATVAVLTLAGCGTITPTVPATTTSEAVQLTPTNAPEPTSTATPEPAQTSVTMLLESLTVAPETNESSYDRDRFNHWVTQPDGCDTRDAVLVRDGQNVTITSDCEVTGTWYSIYDGVTVTDPSDLDIDHRKKPGFPAHTHGLMKPGNCMRMTSPTRSPWSLSQLAPTAPKVTGTLLNGCQQSWAVVNM